MEKKTQKKKEKKKAWKLELVEEEGELRRHVTLLK